MNQLVFNIPDCCLESEMSVLFSRARHNELVIGSGQQGPEQVYVACLAGPDQMSRLCIVTNISVDMFYSLTLSDWGG